MTYQEAKAAIELFESEYIGQDQSELWGWAVAQATHNPEGEVNDT